MCSYDHHAAIYFLLLERLRQHRSSVLPQSNLQDSCKQQGETKRRPSTIAEQAMRKLGLNHTQDVRRTPEEFRPTETLRQEPPRPELPRPELLRGELPRPELPRSDIPRPDLTRTDLTRPDLPRADLLRTEPPRMTHPPFRELPPVLPQAQVFPTEVVTNDAQSFTYCSPRYTTSSFGSFSSSGPTYTPGIVPQYSSSTDEGVETDIEDSSSQRSHQRLSYASSSSSSGVGVHNKSLSQHLSSDSSCSSSHQSNFSTFESSFEYQFESELGSSLPSCTGTDVPPATSNQVVISTSAIHPGVYVSSDHRSWYRHHPVGNHYKLSRKMTRSPVDFREGRRASDGLVAQNEPGTNPKPSVVPNMAFNSQKLNETGKAKGVMELHLVQKEHQALKCLYQGTSQEESSQRQVQHAEYRRDDPGRQSKRISLPEAFPESDMLGSKAPLQQQLMQHRLLQQKRQILQKQGALQQSATDPRRPVFRQASYKLAQQTPILPPLHCDTEFPPIVEDSSNGSCSHREEQLHSIIGQSSSRLSPALPAEEPLLDPSNEAWSSLHASLASCQIADPQDILPWQSSIYQPASWNQVFHQ